jgi:DNA-nicking Smr family endonuclease
MRFHINESIHRPFGHLNDLIKQRKVELRTQIEANEPVAPRPPVDPQQEARLFAEAMADVTPIRCNRHWRPPEERSAGYDASVNEDLSTVKALHQLIETGQGFKVSSTAEYMEARAAGVAPEVVRRLRRGFYAIQDHVDLHGLRVPEAQHALHGFIRQAVLKGYGGVLVIHGRGLTSPHQPILKHKVFEWLTRGPLRKHVIALASSRMCDGGAGATYVLLRSRALTKRQRKNAFLTSV